MLTFVIPVRHQENARDWQQLKQHLASTIRSVCAQTEDQWRAVIVANHGADIPDLPSGFEVHRVDFAPNPSHERGSTTLGDFYDAVRLDKGRRILAGLMFARPQGHVMFLDDDDFVSNRLAAHVAEHPNQNGWYFKEGYVWRDGGSLLYRYDSFHKFCGSSHIVRADLLTIPDAGSQASPEYISRTLGSHIYINDDLFLSGSGLVPLPFIGSVYRIGHVSAHSKSKGLLRHFFFNRSSLARPLRALAGISRLKFLDRRLRAEFFG